MLYDAGVALFQRISQTLLQCEINAVVLQFFDSLIRGICHIFQMETNYQMAKYLPNSWITGFAINKFNC
jgi:hypothetical protein